MTRPATLIYNENSGGSDKISADELKALLHDQGFEPIYRATSREKDLDPILAEVEGLVVAVGGDGTLRAVATRLVGKDVPLAVVPLGTANNVARTLDIKGSPKDIICGLKSGRARPFDLGHVKSPFGEDYFLEAVGCGLFADLLYDYDPEQGKSVRRALDTVKEVLVGYEPRYYQVVLDGEELSDEFIGLEVLNTHATGPRLELAPDADPSDGRFDVVCVRPPKSATLLDYIGSLMTRSFDKLENVEILRGEHLEIAWNGAPIHIDAELRPEPSEWPADAAPARGARPEPQSVSEGRIVVDMLPGALKLVLPGEADD